MNVSGSAALVTGGAGGLGLATATELVRRGAKVVITDLPSTHGEREAERIGAVFSPADVLDEAAVTLAVEAAVAGGPLRILVNCAGIGTPGRLIGKQGVMSLQQFASVVGVNLIGTFNVIRLAAPAMAEADPIDGERGVIINTASVAAFDGQIGQVAYSASKGGIVGLTLPLARDLASSFIRVVTIAPGLMDTPLLATLPEVVRESLAKQVPHPVRLGRPEEFAQLALQIAENALLNGETIRLDGAIRLAPR